MKPRKQFPGATAYFDRHRKRRWRFRRGGFSAELGSDYGSEEFIQRYEDAVNGHKSRRRIGAERTKPYSVSQLIALWYRSPEFLDLAPSTQKVYRGIVEKFREEHGDKPVRLMQRRHVQMLLAEKARTPTAANNLRKRLIQLMDFAISLDWRNDNPARTTKPFRVGGEGFHTWDEDELAQFYETHKSGTLAHTAVTLMLYTGAARVDAVKLGPQNVSDGKIEYRRQKTQRTGGVLVSIPIHPDLAEVLNKLPKDRPFLATHKGRARSPGGLGNLMQQWTEEAKLPQCSAHGLRKACARRLAEAGATAHEIGAVTGHKTLALVQRYTEAAGREGMANSAIEKLIARPNGDRNMANLPERFVKSNTKPKQGKDIL
ncbi:site-specific integrase [Celeribacter halophilus]|uniref:Site-specific recombinase XerD n=1 Tax=Celeribacter halophilus TaxID=576117 RepID=A0A1I3VTF1_9RHOB|nr:tyrosine-type recombinase/integrase [Celeribacter halophilus]PZX08365.1 site-specific recombinase XerD [Celeribacter halophilus]SFJ98399.1 Site-specific recombinase XerD [Celeribacter halophilus]